MAGRRSALLIGADTYLPPFPKLAAPSRDIQAIAQVLQNQAIGGYEVTRLLNRNESELKDAILPFFEEAAEEDTLLIYFSCHGIRDWRSGDLYFVTPQTVRERFQAHALEAGWVRRQMDRSEAGRILAILDCCFSGAFPRGVSPKGDETVDSGEQFVGHVVMTSSTPVAVSFEDAEKKPEEAMSLFTRALVDGLQTGAADADGDGQITVAELYRFASARVKNRQTPTLSNYEVQGEFVVARSLRGAVRRRRARPTSTRLDELFQEGLEVMANGQWQEAIKLFEAVQRFDPAHPGITEQLGKAKAGRDRATQYSRARRLMRRGEWQQVIDTLEALRAAEPGYPDPDGLLDQALVEAEAERKWAAEQAREEGRLQRWQRQAAKAETEEAWDRAVAALEKIVEGRTDYADATERLAKAREEAKKASEEYWRKTMEDFGRLIEPANLPPSTTSKVDDLSIYLPGRKPWDISSSFLPGTERATLRKLPESESQRHWRLARLEAARFASERVTAIDAFSNPYESWNETLLPALTARNRIKGMAEALSSLKGSISSLLWSRDSLEGIPPETFVVFSAQSRRDKIGRFALCEQKLAVSGFYVDLEAGYLDEHAATSHLVGFPFQDIWASPSLEPMMSQRGFSPPDLEHPYFYQVKGSTAEEVAELLDDVFANAMGAGSDYKLRIKKLGGS